MIKIKKALYIPLFLAILTSVFLALSTKTAFAATKTIPLTTVIASDDPMVGEQTASSRGAILKTPLDAVTTQKEDAHVGPPYVYTWRITLPNVCDGAKLQSIRVATNTTAQNESPMGGVYLGLYSGNNLKVNNKYVVNQGEDAHQWMSLIVQNTEVAAIDRGLGGGSGAFPANLGYSGSLDGTWDISDYTMGEPLGISINQWISGTTINAQTTIQSATLTYDDSGCAAKTITNAVSSQPITITTPAGTTITCSSGLNEANQTTKDASFNYPLGLVKFCFDTTNQNNTVNLTYITDLKPSDVVARKYNPSNNAYFNINNATITETTKDNKHALSLTYTITDNGDLDLDPSLGKITDPVGLATLTTSAPNTGIQQHWLLNLK